MLPRFLNHYLEDHSQDWRFSHQCHGDRWNAPKKNRVTWDSFHSWPLTLNGVFQRGKGPILTTYCHLLHPGMMILQVYPPHHSNLSSSKQQPASTFCFGAGGCTNKGVVAQEDRPGEFSCPTSLVTGPTSSIAFRPKQPKRGSCSLTDEVCGEKKRHFLEKEKHTKWFETAKKMDDFIFWTQIYRDNDLVWMYIYTIYLV